MRFHQLMPITFVAAVIAVVSVCSAPGRCDSNRFNVKSFGTTGVALGAHYNPGSLYSYPKSGSSGVVQYQYGPSAASTPAPRSFTSKMPYSAGFGAPGSYGGGQPASFGKSSYGYGSAGTSFTISAPSGFQYYSPPGSFNWNATPPAGYQYTPSGYIWRGGYRRTWTPSQLPNGARALKKVTTWEAPNASDKQLKQAIQNSEIDNGPDDPATVALILDAAKYYVKTKQYEKAEPMLKRLEKLGVSNAEIANLRAGISAGLRSASVKYTGASHSSLNSGGGGAIVGPPVMIQPPSSFDQVRGR